MASSRHTNAAGPTSSGRTPARTHAPDPGLGSELQWFSARPSIRSSSRSREPSPIHSTICPDRSWSGREHRLGPRGHRNAFTSPGRGRTDLPADRKPSNRADPTGTHRDRNHYPSREAGGPRDHLVSSDGALRPIRSALQSGGREYSRRTHRRSRRGCGSDRPGALASSRVPTRPRSAGCRGRRQGASRSYGRRDHASSRASRGPAVAVALTPGRRRASRE